MNIDKVYFDIKNKPVLPKEPDKFIEKEEILYQTYDSKIFFLKDIKILEEYSLEDLIIDYKYDDRWTENDSYFKIKINKKIPNKNYDKQYKKYQKNLEKYNLNMKIYEEKLAQFTEKQKLEAEKLLQKQIKEAKKLLKKYGEKL